MPRFEKSLYEKIFNRHAFGRARTIGKVRKPLYENPNRWNGWVSRAFTTESPVMGKILKPFLSYIHRNFFWAYKRDIYLQRGLSPEDFTMPDHEMRRSSFVEHVWRESTHPYQHLLLKARRRRYYKVERTLQGFFVPQHVRKEAEKRTMADGIRATKEWSDFIYNNYTSDTAPTSANMIGTKLNILDMFLMHGSWHLDAWERYFYNEDIYDIPDDGSYEEYHANPFGYDLQTENGRRQFEAEINQWIADYPGWLVPEGESFNFTAYYAKKAIQYNHDVSEFDADVIAEAKRELQAKANDENRLLAEGEGAEGKIGTNTIGTAVNPAVHPERRAAFMN